MFTITLFTTYTKYSINRLLFIKKKIFFPVKQVLKITGFVGLSYTLWMQQLFNTHISYLCIL